MIMNGGVSQSFWECGISSIMSTMIVNFNQGGKWESLCLGNSLLPQGKISDYENDLGPFPYQYATYSLIQSQAGTHIKFSMFQGCQPVMYYTPGADMTPVANWPTQGL